MAESELSWPKESHDLPPIRWVRWLVAGLVLMMLAFAAHTSGRTARTVMGETRHWIQTTQALPQDLHVPSLGIGTGAAAGSRPVEAPGRQASWLAPLAGAKLTLAFGWHGTGSNAVFRSGIQVTAPRATPVQAGVKGVVARVGRHEIVIRSEGYMIALGGLASPLKTHGQSVQPSTVLGRLDSKTLILTVTKDGYPVNPLNRTLYGSQWLHR